MTLWRRYSVREQEITCVEALAYIALSLESFESLDVYRLPNQPRVLNQPMAGRVGTTIWRFV
jgi:hypothetical protein